MEALGPDYWRFRDPQDFFMGGAVHNVDLLRWMLGEVVQVHSYANHVWPNYALDENYVSNLRFENGCIGRVMLLLGAHLKLKFRVDLNVYGVDGALRANMQRSQVVIDAHALRGETPQVRPVAAANSIASEIAHFVTCVREKRAPLIDAEDGARTVAVCEAAIRSAREGTPIRVSYAPLSVETA
jgi:predicted dehydrogenase